MGGRLLSALGRGLDRGQGAGTVGGGRRFGVQEEGQRGRDGQRQQARGGSHGVTPQSGKENARSMGALRSWLRPPWAVLRCWDGIGRCEIGRASCRERVWQYV